MSTVIVFGPTGSVGSITALTAHEHGAKVILAMRDPQKPIPGLSTELEQSGNFERVQADLTKPDTVAAAVKQSGAKRAFIYRAQTPDGMKATLNALKTAGVEFVVFLSSYTISGEPGDVAPADLIAFVHAQVELSLDEVYGRENYVAVRPGGFATNILRFKDGIVAGEVKIFGGDFQLDGVTPVAMGGVSGTILATGPRQGQQRVYLYGPQLMTQKSAIELVAKVLGKTVKFVDLTPQESLDQYVASGVPKPVAEYMVRVLGQTDGDDISQRAHYDTGVANVQLYTGKPSMPLEEWAEANKGLFTA